MSMENEIEKKIEVETLENEDVPPNMRTSQKSVRFACDEKGSNQSQEAALSDIFHEKPGANMDIEKINNTIEIKVDETEEKHSKMSNIINLNEKNDLTTNQTQTKNENLNNSSDMLPMASFATAELDPYIVPDQILTNSSDNIRFESALTTSSNNAWKFAKRSAIQDTKIDPLVFEAYMNNMNQNSSIFNFTTLHEEIKMKGEFTVLKYLGSGSFGIVLQVKSLKEDKIQAMKLYSADPNNLSSFMESSAELKVLTNLSHVNILPYYGFREYKSHLGILLKFVDDGTLRDLMDKRPISEFLAADFTSQIIRGLCFLHSNGCIHRDIKPSNILLTSFGVVKIGDFGSSKFLNERSTFKATHATTLKGTLMYLAPEVIQRSEYRKECDIWSLGGVIFEMMTNKHLHTESTKVGIYKWKRGVNNKLTLPEEIPELSKDIISMCLEIEPEKRPSCDKLFQHKWFEEQGSFERWIKLQNLLEENSDSKQAEAELTQEITKRYMQKLTFCQRLCPNFMSKVHKRRNLIIFGLIFLLIATYAIVLCTCFLFNEDATEKKDSGRVRVREKSSSLCKDCRSFELKTAKQKIEKTQVQLNKQNKPKDES